MDGGSFSDILRILRHLVYRDIKPANLLVNLKGETKIKDFGISAALEDSMAMCATFVGTVTYMSPERIRNENYSYPADIWSLGLALVECATGEFLYSANEGPVNLMLQVITNLKLALLAAY
ncbi:mitogen-activated protein kinase kinase 3 [Perilla frutescens var. hirtella]|nr:mitogen-activated protein kinase kinase 3 [Perilla frutescens var. hirtella]